jgi:hypothetical protein
MISGQTVIGEWALSLMYNCICHKQIYERRCIKCQNGQLYKIIQ